LTVDYIIVGQGLAGSWLCHHLLAAGKEVLVADKYNPFSASRVSSGVVNPITGRNLVKTWLFDELLAFAMPAYRQMEQLLNLPLWEERNFVWLLQSEHDLNKFTARTENPAYAQHILATQRGEWRTGFRSLTGYAQVGGYYLNSPAFIDAYRQYLLSQNRLVEDWVNADELILLPDAVQWKGITAQKIIFCNGYHAAAHPFFSHLPFAPNKGEALIIQSDYLAGLEKYMVKGGNFLVPKGNNQFWVGSQYLFQNFTQDPPPAIRAQMEATLSKMLTAPYTVVNQIAGIRPSTQQRRPLVGLHPQRPQIGLLNGLGTKGTLMSAYFAHKFVQHLLHNQPLPPEVCW